MTQPSRDCRQRGFHGLMVAQALGSLNDNLIKIVISFLILGEVTDKAASALYLGLCQALFVLPYVLFSSYAGFLADRFSKTLVMRWTKAWEVLIAIVFIVLLAEKNIPLLLILLFMLGVQAALFSPSKYGSLPEMLDEEHLSKGNGYIEFGVFVAILIGTAMGGILKTLGGNDLSLAGYVALGVAFVGAAATFFIPILPIADSQKRIQWNFVRDTWSTIAEVRKNRGIFLALLAVSFFWFAGAIFQPAILLYARDLLHCSDMRKSILLAVVAVGTGIGSIVAGRVSEGKVELGLVPIGAAGMSLFSLALVLSVHSYVFSLLFLALLGFSCGIFVVPLNAYIQQQSPQKERGSYLAAMNVVSFSAMFLSAGLLWFLTNDHTLGFTARGVFGVIGVLSALAGWIIVRQMPETLVRCINWCMSNLLYSLRVRGRENIPKTGGALLVCNHLSFADPSLLLAAVDRPIRFIMYKPIYEAPLVHPVAKAMRAIPIAPELGPKKMIAAFREARDAINNGELVCIFAEGAITRLGRLLPFSRGLERIMDGVDAPIVPVHLDELWGSIFSFREGKFFWKLPKELPYPVTLFFGKPLPSTAKTHEVRQAVQELSADSFHFRHRKYQLLHVGFLRQVKRFPFRKCIADSTGVTLNALSTLTAAVLLAGRLKKLSAGSEGGEKIGILLPASAGGAIANVAALSAGYIPVNLNFTASKDALASAIRQCSMTKVISSRAFLEKIGVELPFAPTFIEDLTSGVSSAEKVRTALLLFFLPSSLIERWVFKVSPTSEETATVMFSSGSTGEPKGVVLSHRNIASNIVSIYDLFQLEKRDCLLGVLPFFHSFGFTGTLWLPLLSGIRAVYHPNPADGATIGKLAQENRATILMSTPTFLLGYLRRCTKEQFQSLKHVVVGAEKLREKVAQAFQERFGVMPLEGYGCTELSPVAMVNLPDIEQRQLRQIGTKLGTVGHPLPGVSARIVDVESGALVEPGVPGLLLIRGPNVMQGYLNDPERTREVVRDGWYITGDIATLDEDGFVTITDRLSRFSKIGGEMVPHAKLEEEIHAALEAKDQICVVTALPDEKKGERIVVLMKGTFEPSILLEKLSARGLPNLWLPKRESIFSVEEFPLLGSGKLDLKAIREQAKQLLEKAGLAQE